MVWWKTNYGFWSWHFSVECSFIAFSGPNCAYKFCVLAQFSRELWAITLTQPYNSTIALCDVLNMDDAIKNNVEALVSILVILFGSIVAKIFRDLIWRPYAFHNVYTAQGIRGQSYHILYGSVPEYTQLLKEAHAHPMQNISHDIVPRVTPHYHKWCHIYGSLSFILFYFKACFTFICLSCRHQTAKTVNLQHMFSTGCLDFYMVSKLKSMFDLYLVIIFAQERNFSIGMDSIQGYIFQWCQSWNQCMISIW